MMLSRHKARKQRFGSPRPAFVSSMHVLLQAAAVRFMRARHCSSECAIGWGFGQLLERGKLVDLFPNWHGEPFPLFAFHPSRAHPPAKVRAFIDFCIEAA